VEKLSLEKIFIGKKKLFKDFDKILFKKKVVLLQKWFGKVPKHWSEKEK